MSLRVRSRPRRQPRRDKLLIPMLAPLPGRRTGATALRGGPGGAMVFRAVPRLKRSAAVSFHRQVSGIGTTGAGRRAAALRTLAELARVFRSRRTSARRIRRHDGLAAGRHHALLRLAHGPATIPRSRCGARHIPAGRSICARRARPTIRWARTTTARAGLVHRYPDRVLFLATDFCSTYCRYCTRARLVGQTGGEYHFGYGAVRAGARLHRGAPRDPRRAALGRRSADHGDDKLDWLLGRLRAIPHVEFLRIGTKVPAVLPQRITPELTRDAAQATTRSG